MIRLNLFILVAFSMGWSFADDNNTARYGTMSTDDWVETCQPFIDGEYDNDYCKVITGLILDNFYFGYMAGLANMHKPKTPEEVNMIRPYCFENSLEIDTYIKDIHDYIELNRKNISQTFTLVAWQVMSNKYPCI